MHVYSASLAVACCHLSASGRQIRHLNDGRTSLAGLAAGPPPAILPQFGIPPFAGMRRKCYKLDNLTLPAGVVLILIPSLFPN